MLAVAAGAIVALVAWPAFVSHQTASANPTPAPLVRDDLYRGQLVRFYERQVRTQPQDQISMRMLAQQYMQRFREGYDLGDVARAERLAKRSIELQPQGNTSAHMTLASAMLSYHDFRNALAHERAALAGEPSNANAAAQIASLEMEMGQYAQAARTLQAIAPGPAEDPSVDAVRARYHELTGHLDLARAEIARAMQSIDSGINAPAYDRSWYHLRSAQLAFEAGDAHEARDQVTIALADFPNNAMALLWSAKFYRAQGDWQHALADATRCADLYPLPQALGYKADAERALGDAHAARATDALIAAEQRLFNVQGINDRLLANYYAQRGMHLDVALQAARSDYAKRGDEVYADDTLAWVLARGGRWSDARPYAERALRLGTQDPSLQYHAAVIELHTGNANRAKALLESALAENPAFDPIEGADARSILAKLRTTEVSQRECVSYASALFDGCDYASRNAAPHRTR